jgi:toxin ParE1/3/4
MGFKLIILEDAYSDIDQAVEYYFNINSKLAARFNQELNKNYGLLRKNPFFEIRYKDYRALPMKTFPYILLFTIDEKIKTVSVYSVFHTSQNPRKYPRKK